MSARTSARIGQTTHNGTACTNCGTAYDECTRALLYPLGRACCSTCGYTDTHDEQPGEPPAAVESVNLSAAAAWLLTLEDDTSLAGSSQNVAARLVWARLTGLPEAEAVAYARTIVDRSVTAHIAPF